MSDDPQVPAVPDEVSGPDEDVGGLGIPGLSGMPDLGGLFEQAAAQAGHTHVPGLGVGHRLHSRPGKDLTRLHQRQQVALHGAPALAAAVAGRPCGRVAAGMMVALRACAPTR